MNLNQYNAFRDELVSLVHKFADIFTRELEFEDKATDDPVKRNLSLKAAPLWNTLKAIKEANFRIVLISPFQGGKSTIFNTVCGGLELSPTGFGIKTSACRAEAHYLDSGDECAEVEWRDGSELVLGFVEMLLPELSKDFLKKQGLFGEPSVEDIAHQIDLGNTVHRQRLLDAVEHLEQQEKRGQTRLTSEQRDVLNVAWLTLHHYPKVYSSAEPVECKVPVDKASQWLRFPADWSMRAREKFAPDEIRFLFLRKVKFFVRSADLRRLQAVVVDCPGLQASAWDTRVARECIKESHAIIFLLGTQGAAIGQSQLAEAATLGEYGLKGGIFLGYNAKGTTERQSRKILAYDLGRLKDMGLTFDEHCISVFNALLAYRVKQFQLMSNGQLPLHTIRALVAKAGEEIAPDVLADWGKDNQDIARHLIAADLKGAFEKFTGRALPELNEQTSLQVEEASHWKDVMEKAATFVVQRRGRAMLLDRGASLVHATLGRSLATLRDREQSLDRTVEQAEQEKKSAETASEEFKRQITTIKRAFQASLLLEDSGTQQPLRDELLAVVQMSRTALLHELEGIIEQADGQQGLAARLTARATSHINSKITGWDKNLQMGGSPAYRGTVQRHVDDLREGVRKAVAKVQTVVGPLLQDLDCRLAQEVSEEAFVEGLATSSFPGMALESFLDSCSNIPGFEWVRKQFFDPRAWKACLPDYLDKMGERIETCVHGHVGKLLEAFSHAAVKELDEAVKEFQTQCEARVVDRDRILSESRETRQLIAEKAKALREQTLEPMQQSIDRFIATVESSLAEPEALQDTP